jgi:hypothetical protein
MGQAITRRSDIISWPFSSFFSVGYNVVKYHYIRYWTWKGGLYICEDWHLTDSGQS